MTLEFDRLCLQPLSKSFPLKKPSARPLTRGHILEICLQRQLGYSGTGNPTLVLTIGWTPAARRPSGRRELAFARVLEGLTASSAIVRQWKCGTYSNKFRSVDLRNPSLHRAFSFFFHDPPFVLGRRISRSKTSKTLKQPPSMRSVIRTEKIPPKRSQRRRKRSICYGRIIYRLCLIDRRLVPGSSRPPVIQPGVF